MTASPRRGRFRASRRYCMRAGSARSSGSRSSISRTTPSTIRRSPTRTAWCRWRSPRRATSASPPSHAPRPAIWRQQSRRMRRARDFSRVIFMPEGVESGKIVGSTIYGARVITIRGNYDDVNRLCSEIADKYGWAFVNINLRPYYTEGAKTFGFEVAEQLGWQTAQPYRAADRGRHDSAQGRQGLQGTQGGRAGPRRRFQDSLRAGGRLPRRSSMRCTRTPI